MRIFDRGYERRRIPNGQVLDAALQYDSARKLLADEPPESGVLLPQMHCAALALELFLKALGADDVYIDTAPPTGAVWVHAQPESREHDPSKLFSSLSDELRAE